MIAIHRRVTRTLLKGRGALNSKVNFLLKKMSHLEHVLRKVALFMHIAYWGLRSDPLTPWRSVREAASRWASVWEFFRKSSHFSAKWIKVSTMLEPFTRSQLLRFKPS